MGTSVRKSHLFDGSPRRVRDEVVIPGRLPEEEVAHGAADDERPRAVRALAQPLRDLAHALRERRGVDAVFARREDDVVVSEVAPTQGGVPCGVPCGVPPSRRHPRCGVLRARARGVATVIVAKVFVDGVVTGSHTTAFAW
eukprot:29770-Pelagococcus_subviridis.AAC.3